MKPSMAGGPALPAPERINSALPPVPCSTAAPPGLALAFPFSGTLAERRRPAFSRPRAGLDLTDMTHLLVIAHAPLASALRDAALATPEPQRPAEADQHDLTGAIAAAQYFITLYPYVYATGDLTAFRAMSDATCKFCDSVITSATNMHTSGGWADPWGQQITFTSITADVSTPNRYVVEFHLVSDQHVAHNTGKSPVTVEAFEMTLLVQVLWKDGTGWIVEEVATQ